jgi:hypothetical protein
MKNLKRPKAISAAYFDGISRADEWLERGEKPLPFASSAAWRKHCFAAAVRKYAKQPESPALLAEWEHGFDSTLKQFRKTDQIETTIQVKNKDRLVITPEVKIAKFLESESTSRDR